MINHISLRAKLKQCVGFYQVATNIQEVYNLEMPSDTQATLPLPLPPTPAPYPCPLPLPLPLPLPVPLSPTPQP
jgi:hypothetical protein